MAMVAVHSSTAHSAVLLVGPGGDFSTIQAAVDVAASNMESDEIRIAEGTFTESVRMFRFVDHDGLSISGGWDPSFSAIEGTSIINGGGIGRVLDMSIIEGDVVELRNLIFEDGAAENNAGVLASVTDATLLISSSIVRNNIASGVRSEGGGLVIRGRGSADVRLIQVTIADNQVLCSGNFSCSVGGLRLDGDDEVYFEVTGSTIEGNRVEVLNSQGSQAGASISSTSGGTVVFNDNVVRDNVVVANDSGIVGVVLSAGVSLSAARNQILRNTAESAAPEFSSQMRVNAFVDAEVTVENTLIADGNGKGLVTRIFDNGTAAALHLVNLTIANHGDIGLQGVNLSDTAAFTISNSIVTGSRIDLIASAAQQTTNLIGASGLFVNEALGNYQLAAGSPAIDAGTFPAPVPIGSGDAAGLTRVVGSAIDIGALEFGADVLFSNGFELN
ncbi:MAG: choice-of-anchor Q domain-containing protein [Lysobacterales bacterium]